MDEEKDEKQPAEDEGHGPIEDEVREWFERSTSETTEEEVAEADGRAAEVEEKVGAVGPLRRQLARIRVMLMMLSDWRAGRWRDVPWTTIATIAALALYLLNPIDLIPDMIPGIGYADDLAAIALAWRVTRRDVRRYAAWKVGQPGCSEAEAKAARQAFPGLVSG